MRVYDATARSLADTGLDCVFGGASEADAKRRINVLAGDKRGRAQ